jgi:predicted NUDIX family NTP pyrophosphohydrolase
MESKNPDPFSLLAVAFVTGWTLGSGRARQLEEISRSLAVEMSQDFLREFKRSFLARLETRRKAEPPSLDRTRTG